MSLVMACWKQNDFNNTVCSKEVSAFYTCVEKTQVRQTCQHNPQTSGNPHEPTLLINPQNGTAAVALIKQVFDEYMRPDNLEE